MNADDDKNERNNWLGDGKVYGATSPRQKQPFFTSDRRASVLSLSSTSSTASQFMLFDNELRRKSTVSVLTYDLFEKDRAEVDDDFVGIAWHRATLIFLTVAISAGVVNIPHLIHMSGGIIPSLFVQILLLHLCLVSSMLTVWCADVWRCSLYQDILLACFGRIGEYLSSAIIFFVTFAYLIAIMIAIGDQLNSVTALTWPNFAATGSFFATKGFLMSCTAFVAILPLLFARHIEKLQAVSVVANVSLILLIITVFFEYIKMENKEAVCFEQKNPTIWQAVRTMPAFTINYTYNLTTVAVYGRMRQKSLSSAVKADALTRIVAFSLYNILGYAVYQTFGSALEENFLINYNALCSWTVTITGLLFALKLCTTYPIEYFLIWTTVCTMINGAGWTRLVDYKNHPKTAQSTRFVYGFGFLCSKLLVASLTKDIGIVLDIASAIFIHIQFTIPAFCVLATLNRSICPPLTPLMRLVMLLTAHTFIVLGFVMSIALLLQRFSVH